MSNVVNIKAYKNAKSLKKEIDDLLALEKALKDSLNSLTKWDKYYIVNSLLGRQFETYQNIKQVIHTKQLMLKTFEIRNVDE